jgi:hypothetical protein
MEDAGIPQSNIPSIWSFKYKGEIFIKNIGDADIHVDSIKLILKHPNVRFEINPNTQEGTILLTKGKPHTTFFFFEPENKDLQKFMEAKSMVEVIDLDGKKYSSDWGTLNFPKLFKDYH